MTQSMKMPDGCGVIAHDRTMAFDSGGSVRNFDQDGRLHIASTNISKANVCPYRGAEIPNYEALGLLPNKVYQLYRDPLELSRAAASFNNIPLLSQHVPVSADSHQPELVVGATGSDAVFDAPYLKNSLVIWAADAIEGVQSNQQRELSCSYRFTPDMKAGTTSDGARYDGVMRNILGNHVALVATGRAGPDVVVGDSQMQMDTTYPMKQTELSSMTNTPLAAYDDDIEAEDADMGVQIALLTRRIEALEAHLGKKVTFDDDDNDEEGMADDGIVSQTAMDATIKLATDRAVADALSRSNAIFEAKKAVALRVGELAVACDSAEAVYEAALMTMGVDTSGMPAGAFKFVFDAHASAGLHALRTRVVAHDAAMTSELLESAPSLARFIRN